MTPVDKEEDFPLKSGLNMERHGRGVSSIKGMKSDNSKKPRLWVL